MPLLETVAAGALGTLAMSVVMALIHQARWANADMIRALGSFATGTYERSVMPGLVIHAAAGVTFAFPYAILLSIMTEPALHHAAAVGGVMGLLHGIVMSFILLAVVRYKHPLEKFRTAGLDVALAHVAGHVAYGAVVGATLAELGAHWRLLGR